ncbi:MAG TPA: hypothetical protein VEC13_00195, partial [Candidatus Paceibacterota bacterium]|nr:hypothetical protein [Candidatus Paceibacterota bacterium]
MSDIKTIIGIISVVLVFIAYIPYIRNIFKGTTKPHMYSWLLWGILSFIIYAMQVSAGAGPGSWITLCIGLVVLYVFILSIKRGTKDVKPIDLVFLIIGLLTIPLWLLAEQPVLSMIIVTAIDLIGFLPTIRKSWNDPYSETL